MRKEVRAAIERRMHEPITYDLTVLREQASGLQVALSVCLSEFEGAMDHVKELEQENARLRAALQQYADAGNWQGAAGGDLAVWLGTGNGYDLARQALKEEG